MRMPVLVLAGLLAGSVPGASPAQAQTTPAPAGERAPGVPLAPRPGETVRPPAGEGAAPRVQRRGADEAGRQAPPRPERDPPMPRPVPSIIAP